MIINTWQACPICVNSEIKHCDVCNGTRLISTISGKPPKQNIPYMVPYNANATIGVFEFVK